MSWNNRSYFSGQSGNSQYSSSTDGYGGGQNEATGGKKPPPSRLKKSGGIKAEADYPSYTANTNHNGDKDNSNYSGAYSNGGYNGYGSTPYNTGGSNTTPYYGEGGGYNNSNGGDGYTGGAAIPYNVPAAFFAPQDGTRSPMFINTREVHVHGAPGSQYDNDNNRDQRRRGGGSGFFGPALEAVGYFFDRKLGLRDRD